MALEVRAAESLLGDGVVINIGVIRLSRGGEEEESEFEGAGAVDAKDVGAGPLGAPGFFGTDGLVWEGVGSYRIEVPHLVIGGFVVHCGLIDQPDFNGVVHEAGFVVGDTDDHCCVFVEGEVLGIVCRFSRWSEEVELGEGLPGFRHGDHIGEGSDDDKDGDDEDGGEGTVDWLLLFREAESLGEGEAFLRVGFSPAVDAVESDGEDEEQQGEHDGLQADAPGGVVQQQSDEGDDRDGQAKGEYDAFECVDAAVCFAGREQREHQDVPWDEQQEGKTKDETKHRIDVKKHKREEQQAGEQAQQEIQGVRGGVAHDLPGVRQQGW